MQVLTFPCGAQALIVKPDVYEHKALDKGLCGVPRGMSMWVNVLLILVVHDRGDGEGFSRTACISY